MRAGLARPRSPVNPQQLALPIEHLESFLARSQTHGIARPRRVFCNRNLRMAGSSGSASTWTTRWPSTTSRRWTSCRSRRRSRSSSPAATRTFIATVPATRPTSRSAGLLIDKRFGHILKMDRYKYVDEGLPRPPRAREGRAPRALPREEDPPGDAALPLDRHALRAQRGDALRGARRRASSSGATPSTTRALFTDIRECIDEAHRDGTILDAVIGGPPALRRQGPRARADAAQAPQRRQEALPAHELALGVHRRSDDLPARRRDARVPDVANYFDIVIVAATKPAFFQERRPLLERDGDDGPSPRRSRSSAARSTRAATSSTSSARSASTGDEVLYVGDHIYGDILRSKKESAWRTAMIIQELEAEVARPRVAARRTSTRAEARGARASGSRTSSASTRARFKELTRQIEHAHEKPNGAPAAALEAERAPRSKRAVERIRGRLAPGRRRAARDRAPHRPALPPLLGLAPQGGRTRSRASASRSRSTRASTRRASRTSSSYSPQQYFRSPRDVMAHELP